MTSVVSLALAGRWLKGFGTTGLTADDAEDATKAFEELEGETAALRNQLHAAKRQIAALIEERDEARGVAVELNRRLEGRESDSD